MLTGDFCSQSGYLLKKLIGLSTLAFMASLPSKALGDFQILEFPTPKSLSSYLSPQEVCLGACVFLERLWPLWITASAQQLQQVDVNFVSVDKESDCLLPSCANSHAQASIPCSDCHGLDCPCSQGLLLYLWCRLPLLLAALFTCLRLPQYSILFPSFNSVG